MIFLPHVMTDVTTSGGILEVRYASPTSFLTGSFCFHVSTIVFFFYVAPGSEFVVHLYSL